MKRLNALPQQAFLIAFLLFSSAGYSQAVTEIVTDFNGYWRSSAAAISPVKPNNSHNLLSFTFNGSRYATGVNNPLLIANGLSFMSTDFRALGVSAINGTVVANTKVGLGALYDGVSGGASNPAPSGSLPSYLSDGPQGLDLGTGIANLPVGSLVFGVSNLMPSAIGDGIPDIVVTQIADPSASSDTYQFTDGANNVIGNPVSISFSTIDTVGMWTADFYEASQNPMTLSAGLQQTDRPIRLWAADFSAFGINGSNYSMVSTFRMNMAGNSDVAFVAYNYATVSLLPVSLNFLKAITTPDNVKLVWQTPADKQIAAFIIEGSNNGADFWPVGRVSSTYNAADQNYSFNHSNRFSGYYFYRLKQVDHTGAFTYSKIVKITANNYSPSLEVFPNPAKNKIIVLHPSATEATMQLWNAGGVKVLERKVQTGTYQSQLDLQQLAAGFYTLLFIQQSGSESVRFLKE